MMAHFFIPLAIDWLIIILMMTIAWLIARRMNNAGVVDVFWAAGFSLIVLGNDILFQGSFNQKILITLVVMLASLRLAYHLLTRFLKHADQEDPRYHQLREKWQQKSNLMFFGVFQLQGLVMVLVSIPFAMVTNHTASTWSIFEYIGVLVWVIGFICEAIADNQLKHFVHHPDNKGRVCSTGLWRYSRHPNYFFEWLMWVGYFFIAVGVPSGWLSFFSPLIMLYILTWGTGIALTEAQSIQTKGDAYRQYQKQTSAFIPWFPKSNAPVS